MYVFYIEKGLAKSEKDDSRYLVSGIWYQVLGGWFDDPWDTLKV
ncbi:MAG: hypothetical protein AAF934_07250 [Bacteroidota bacterium]